jgi:protease-4
MRIRYPLLALVLLSGAVAATLLLAGLRSHRTSALPVAAFGRGRIALVEITGVITSSHQAGNRAASARRVVEQLEKYGEDDSVKAVLVRVDSPGGTVVAAQEIHAALKRLRSRGKKVVVSMADLAASGGYYIACAADRVYASPGTLTGSIGVIMQFPNVQGLLGKIGVSATTIKSGEFKDLGNSFREMTERDRRLLQGLVDDVYQQFVEAVAAGRSLPPERVRDLADGRIYSGRQAKELGLVDELGDFDAALKATAQLAGIRGKPEVLREKTRPRFWELLDARIAAFASLAPFLDTEFGQARLLYLWQ